MHALIKFLNSFKYAFRGIGSALLSEWNMRVHLLAVLVVVTAGLYFKITLTEWCLVSICFGVVIAAEMFNTALEHLTDLVQPEQHPIAGKIKDVAAGAVLVAAIASVVVAVLVFWKYFFPAY